MDGIEQHVASFFILEGQRLGLAEIPGSRRVIIYDLPPGISLTSVLKAVSANGDPENGIPGGIVSAQVFSNTASWVQEKDLCAMIEFAHPSVAEAYVRQVQDSDIHFEVQQSGNSARFPLKAELACSHSNLLRPDTIYALLAEQTRSLLVPLCPQELVWHMLSTIGISSITNAEYQKDSSLAIELVSMFEARRAYELLRHGQVPAFAICALLPPRFVPDSTQQQPFEVIQGKNIPLERETITAKFNRRPYKPSWYSPSSQDWAPFHRPSLAYLISSENDVLPCDLVEWLETRRDFGAQDYKIAGTKITVTRKAYTWDIGPEEHLKLLLATSLHDRYLEEAWDDYFHLRKLPNLRRYEAYRAACAGESTIDQSDSDIDTVVDSDAEAWSASSSTVDHLSPTSSFDDSIISPVEMTVIRQMLPEKVVLPESEFLSQPDGVSSQIALNRQFQERMPWVSQSEPLLPPVTVSKDAQMDLIPGLEASGYGFCDVAECGDWLWSLENRSPGEMDAGHGDGGSDLGDLISFD